MHNLFIQFIWYFEISQPIFSEMIELVGVNHDQSQHGKTDDNHPECVHNFSPYLERPLEKSVETFRKR